jgi:xanthine dehydrogenase accessory factor
MRKHEEPEAQLGLAEVTVGLGPSLVAGRHGDVVVETSWDLLGAIITAGASRPLAGEPRELGGHARDRYVYAPGDGIFRTKHVSATPFAEVRILPRLAPWRWRYRLMECFEV